MKSFVQNGETIEFTADGAVEAGDIIELSDMVAVAVDNVADTEKGVGITSGVVKLPKISADEIDQGATVYVSSTGKITITSTDNTPAGKAWIAAGNGDTEIDVKINA